MRGEYATSTSRKSARAELPPRARRILTYSFNYFGSVGTTSACAENTEQATGTVQNRGNYLRVRGEYGNTPPRANAIWELPPRARRIRLPEQHQVRPGGTTSACAENTPQPTPARENPWNYLRVRGEYDRHVDIATGLVELPPRARRIPLPGFFRGG